ncbi:MAG: hypothetical protein QSU88_04790, partial [Candidatus Methanoperedens sp.]|nr:hypothetical protein [Candidatus Methanoperedens sp.]
AHPPLRRLKERLGERVVVLAGAGDAFSPHDGADDRPLKSNEKEILVKLKKEPIVKTKIDVPEDIVLEIAEKDIEELV